MGNQDRIPSASGWASPTGGRPRGRMAAHLPWWLGRRPTRLSPVGTHMIRSFLNRVLGRKGAPRVRTDDSVVDHEASAVPPAAGPPEAAPVRPARHLQQPPSLPSPPGRSAPTHTAGTGIPTGLPEVRFDRIRPQGGSRNTGWETLLPIDPGPRRVAGRCHCEAASPPGRRDGCMVRSRARRTSSVPGQILRYSWRFPAEPDG